MYIYIYHYQSLYIHIIICVDEEFYILLSKYSMGQRIAFATGLGWGILASRRSLQMASAADLGKRPCRVSVGIGWDRPVIETSWRSKFVSESSTYTILAGTQVKLRRFDDSVLCSFKLLLFQCWCFAFIHVNAISCPSTCVFCSAWSFHINVSWQVADLMKIDYTL